MRSRAAWYWSLTGPAPASAWRHPAPAWPPAPPGPSASGAPACTSSSESGVGASRKKLPASASTAMLCHSPRPEQPDGPDRFLRHAGQLRRHHIRDVVQAPHEGALQPQARAVDQQEARFSQGQRARDRNRGRFRQMPRASSPGRLSATSPGRLRLPAPPVAPVASRAASSFARIRSRTLASASCTLSSGPLSAALLQMVKCRGQVTGLEIEVPQSLVRRRVARVEPDRHVPFVECALQGFLFHQDAGVEIVRVRQVGIPGQSLNRHLGRGLEPALRPAAPPPGGGTPGWTGSAAH